MAVTWVPPLGAVQNVVATASAGGSITPGTYYIRVCAANFDRYTAHYKTVGSALRGAPSVETSVVITAGNQTMNISWDAVPGATHYNVYVTNVATGATRWIKSRIDRLTDSSAAYATTANTSIQLTANTYLGATGLDFDSFVYPTTYTWDGNLDRELGFGYILISGSVGDLTLQDIVDVLVAASATDYYYWDGNYFVLKGGITVEDNASGSLSVIEELFLLSQNTIHSNETDNFFIYFTDAVIIVDAWSDRFCRYVPNAIMSGCMVKRVANAYTSTAYVKGADLRCMFDSGRMVDGGGNLLNKVTTYIAAIYSATIISRLVSKASAVLTGSFGATTVYDSTFFSFVSEAEGSVGGVYKFVRCLIGQYYTSYNFIFRDAITAPVVMVDVDFVTLSNDITDNLRPKINWSSTNAYNNILDLKYSFNVKTEPGATVVLTDANGTEIFSEVADANGDITEQEVLATRCTHDPATGIGVGFDYTIFTDYGDFDLKISKSGFKTYTDTIVLDNPKKLQIELKKVLDNNFSNIININSQ